MACIGDSLTHGAGVFPTSSFPAILEEFLNRFAWNHIVEVVNEGQSGYSIHDDLLALDHIGEGYTPDVVVLGLCDNDAELVPAQAGEYVVHRRKNWSPRGFAYPLFIKSLETLRDKTRAMGIPLVTAYLCVNGDDEELSGYGAQLGRLCNRLEIDFIDTSRDFTGPQSAQNNSKAYVSEADGHPSESAHRTIAMTLARHLMLQEHLGKRDSPCIPEPDVFQKAENAAVSALRLGCPPTVCCNTLARRLESKKQSRSRLRLAKDYLMQDEHRLKIQDYLKQEQALLLRLQFRQGYADTMNPGVYDRMDKLRRNLERINRKLLMLEHFDAAIFPEEDFMRLGCPEVTRNPGRNTPTVIAECTRWTAILNHNLAQLAEEVELFDDPGVLRGHLRREMHAAAAATARQWEECRTLLHICRQQAERIVPIFIRIKKEPVTPAIIEGLATMQGYIDAIALDLSQITQAMQLDSMPGFPNNIRGVHSHIRVTAKPNCTANGIRIEQHPLNAAQVPASDMHFIVQQSTEHSYDLLFPHVVNADYLIESVPGDAPPVSLSEVIASIRLTTPANCVVNAATQDLDMESPSRGWLRLRLLQ